MPRPNFPFPGYWLGVGGKIQVHTGLDAAPETTGQDFGTSATSARDNAGVVDHIAFQGTDAEGMGRHLAKLGLPVKTRHIAEISAVPDFRRRSGRTDDRTQLPRSSRGAHLGTIFARSGRG